MDEQRPTRVRFGAFELELTSGELTSTLPGGAAKTVILAQQPFRLLLLFIEREGAMVTREEIQKRFWPSDTVVEFDHSINVAIGKLRKALGDSADKPQYIATVASRGYRLLVTVDRTPAVDNDPLPPVADAARPAVPSPASVETGQTVSHYRVLDVIGGGGMGVVYRAEDLRLGRRVAIKFLPSETVTNQETLLRFEREAQTASSLNHPNICTIYEFGEHEGQPFLVMELLQGETLRDRLAAAHPETGLPLDSLIDIALQVSCGLEAAHERRIIHRDIKPANIFLTDKGVCKILDFGLAKLLEIAERETEILPTPSPGEMPFDLTLSRVGLTMGTAGYMSPEQVRGEKLDARSDLFSFGLVIYEMATGVRAFGGETVAMVRDAIVHRQQARVRDLNPTIPPQLEAIIDAALEKDRDRRSKSAAAMRAGLERLTDDARSAVPHPIPSDAHEIAGLKKRHRKAIIALIVAACAIAALALAWLWRPSRHASQLIEAALTQNSFEAPVVDAALSPNGNLLAYTDASGLNLKVIDSGEVHSLMTPPASRITRIAWFPDSSSLLFTAISTESAQRQLWAGSIFGGRLRLLRNDADDASISADGSELLFSNAAHNEIWAMDATGANARKLIARDDLYLYHPAWYAGRHRILYLLSHDVSRNSAVAGASLESLDIETGESLTVCNPCMEFALLPGDRLLYTSASSAWKVPIDPRTARPLSAPVEIAGNFDGEHPTLSADGKRLVILKGNNDPAAGLGAVVFLANLEDKGRRLNNPRRLTLGVTDYTHAWTPDGQAVVFESKRNGRFGIFRQLIDQSVAEPLVTGNESVSRGRFSPDGAWLLYVAGDITSSWRLMRMAAAGGPSELVIDGQGLENYYCTTAAANLCVLAEREQNELVFYAFDPTRKLPPSGIPHSDLRELARTDFNPSDWGLSPDGATIAMVRPSNREGRIHMLRLRSQNNRPAETAPAPDVLVDGWTNLFNLNWSADGSGWYICNADPGRATFLYVDLQGHATVLQSQEGVEPFWGVPSPDGRHLAFSKTTFIDNAWLIEHF
jgi:serine/threonine protein kinase